MRDVGVLTTAIISTEEWLAALDAFATRKGKQISHAPTESVIGKGRDAIYARNLPPENNAYYSDEERLELERRLGGPVKGCASIHVGPTETAKKLAIELAQEMQGRWTGLLDYGGMGGGLGVPP